MTANEQLTKMQKELEETKKKLLDALFEKCRAGYIEKNLSSNERATLILDYMGNVDQAFQQIQSLFSEQEGMAKQWEATWKDENKFSHILFKQRNELMYERNELWQKLKEQKKEIERLKRKIEYYKYKPRATFSKRG